MFACIIPNERFKLLSVLLRNCTLTVVPVGFTGGTSLHGSVVATAGKVGGSRVGMGGIVGSGVNVAVGEGGMGVCVAVGMAN